MKVTESVNKCMDNNRSGDFRKTVFSNFIWRFLERFGAKGVSLVVSVILARMLEPAVYGTLSIMLVLTSAMQLLVDSGLGNALIQKLDADNRDFSSVFYFNLFFCTMLYFALFWIAVPISKVYNDAEMIPMIRVLGVVVVISGVKNVQQAYVSKKMLFRKFFFSTLGGTIVSAIVGIVMAYLDYGIWALIVQYLLNAIVDTLILWISVDWRPSLFFSFTRLKSLLNFAWKWLASAIIYKVYLSARSLIIGKRYSTESLAYYEESNKYASFFSSNIGDSINSVLFPAMASVQNDREEVKKIARRSIKISFFVISPILIGFACLAEDFVKLVLTAKWLPIVPYLRIFCVTFVFYPVHTINLNIIKSLGESGMILKLEIIKAAISIAFLVATINHGVLVVAYGALVMDFVGQVANAYPNKKLLDYGYFDQIKDYFPIVFTSILMGMIIFPIRYIPIHTFWVLLIQIVVGIVVYFWISKLLHIDSAEYLKNLLSSFFAKDEKRSMTL